MRMIWMGLLVACSSSQSGASEPGSQEVAEAPSREEGDQMNSSDERTAGVGLPQEGHPFTGVITAGQPDEAGLRAAKRAGVTRVVNLRSDGEPLTAEEPAMAASLGLQYQVIPISDAEDLTEANAAALDAALEGAEGEVLVHCGSSNRVGALFALRAFYREGATVEEAMALGAVAGMTRMTDAVRSKLEAACAELPGDPRCE